VYPEEERRKTKNKKKQKKKDSLLLLPNPPFWQMRFARVFRSLTSRPLRVAGSCAVVGLTSSVWFAASVQEPYTKTPFEEECHGLSLLGLGLRSKYSWFSVYAYGLYADKALLTVEEPALFSHLIAVQSPKILRLVFQRDVSGTDMENAISASLAPRVDAAVSLFAFSCCLCCFNVS
jgi:hypothetical protein